MVDITKAMESGYITVDLVRDSPTKKCVIIDGGEYKDAKDLQGKTYEKFELTVEIDHKQKLWSPNKDSLKNISAELGKDSSAWVGKIIKLNIGKSLGKDCVVGMPMPQ